MGMRSNMFANLENEYVCVGNVEMTAMTVQLMSEIMSAWGEDADLTQIFGILVTGAQMGVAGKNNLGQEEKELIDIVFGQMYNGPIDEIYQMVGSEITDEQYKIVELITQLGNHIAIPFLRFVLCFAYIDGYFEEEVANKLDGLFGLNLLAEFFQSEQEEVPPQTLTMQVDRLEEKLFDYFKQEDPLVTLEIVCEKFPEEQKSEIEHSLNSLCEKGVLYKMDTFCGVMYAMVP